MKRLVLAAIVIAALACKVQKTGQDTYKVVAPTPEAKAAAKKAQEKAKVVGAELKEEAGKAAKATGTALENAGKKVQEKTDTRH
jgi:hypothetical protein